MPLTNIMVTSYTPSTYISNYTHCERYEVSETNFWVYVLFAPLKLSRDVRNPAFV